MKKTIVSIFILLCCGLHIYSQHDVSLSIQKEYINGEFYAIVSIKNNNPHDIIISTYASWMGAEGVYSRLPKSYLQFIGESSSLISRKTETGKIILSKEYDIEILDRSKAFLQIKAGATHSEKYLLFGETFIPYKAFSGNQRNKAKRIRAKVNLTYLYLGDRKNYDKQIISNIISL